MRFRRVAVFAAALVAGAAMAQDAPPSSVSTTPAQAASSQPANVSSTASAASVASAASTAAATSTPAPASSAKLIAAKLGPFSGDPAAGKTKAAVCGACHGIDGNSTIAMYPKLAGQNEHYIVEQLKNFKSGERKNAIMMGMAAPLSLRDMHDIGAYFASQTAKAGVADQALVAAGRKLYRQGNDKRDIPACMSCHGPDGRGNPGPPYAHLAGQHAQYVQQVLTAWHNGETWGTGKHNHIMPSIAKKLTKQDILAVSSYIEGLHTNKGVFAAE